MNASPYALAGLLAVAGCAHQKTAAVETPPPPAALAEAPVSTPSPEPIAAQPAPPALEPVICSTDAQCSSSELCLRSACTAITPAMDECGNTAVHFDLDRSTLRDDARPVLDRAARCISANPDGKVLITGNSDERGSVRYNLGLGDRRAQEVQDYLKEHGVLASQLQVVSYGKELPVCGEHDGACWARNRRASLEPNGKAKDIARIVRLDERAERRTAKVASASKAMKAKDKPMVATSTSKSKAKHGLVQGRHP